MRRASQTRISQSMVEKGYVTRIAHETDRRRLIVNIAPAGQEIIRNNEARAGEIANSFIVALGKEKFDTLLDLLQDLEKIQLQADIERVAGVAATEIAVVPQTNTVEIVQNSRKREVELRIFA